ncbi:MAG: hypothetical protein ISS74_00270 [Planctomycetes bacterium]|nr:hypothetical protein [Planctomycetota bacterium]
MRGIATSVAVFTLLLLAAIGTASGVPPFVCSLRALAGAFVAYVLTTIAGRMAIRILVSVIRSGPNPSHRREEHLR